MPQHPGAKARQQTLKGRANRHGDRDGGPVVSTGKAHNTSENRDD